MRLSAKYQPATLDEIVGQPAPVRRLKTLVMEPYPSCWLLTGEPGTGKSATAKALVADLDVSEYGGLTERSGSNLTIEEVRRLFWHTFRTRPMFGSPWSVLLIEELELLPSRNVSAALKDELSEQHHPPRLIVVATSNDPTGLDRALLDRFRILAYSSGPTFAEACQERLQTIWEAELGEDVPFPTDTIAGWNGRAFSMRRALHALGATVEVHKAQKGQGVTV